MYTKGGVRGPAAGNLRTRSAAMVTLPFSVALLTFLTVFFFLGFGQRVLDRMRLTDGEALIILLLMIGGHFLPTISLTSRAAVNLGGLIPLGVGVYLLLTTSGPERGRAAGVTLVTAGLILLTDKLLPLQPGLLDPVFSGGIFAGLTATFWGRSRRSAFIAGLLGVLLVDLASVIQLLLQGVEEQLTLGSGGLFSSMVLSAFLAVIITEVIGEVREALHLGGGQNG
ncbi:MAG: hypothetical protein WBI99_10115 [Limnochordia bacterium]|nr:DUF1614 domain-containing protein [Limnochordia bacterium]NLO94471.1 DUF1614 domain-containing protein [Bacillota bacterium]HOK32722.1 DUF1614 domain-containing protein [Limnochordia bacterium]HOM01150.1 DUF1614 domain-containing protein [Limnochordia bacterium]HOQ74889.1 DUF1614 domain-containing protein [Limnochordia bacterium]